MKVSQKMRAFAAQHLGTAADASEGDVSAAITKALSEGKLTFAQAAELEVDPDPKAAVESLVAKTVNGAMTTFETKMDAKFDSILKAVNAGHATTTNATTDNAAAVNLKTGEVVDDAAVIAAAQKGRENIRVKAATERYDNSTKALTWTHDRGCKNRRVGDPVTILENTFGGRDDMAITKNIDALSKAQYAKLGVVFMNMIAKQTGVANSFLKTEHGQALLKEAAHEDKWGGYGDETTDDSRRLKDFQIKTILDDSTSGGEQAVPEYFDYDAIRVPLLHGELFPWVQLVRVNRGSAAHGYKIGTPTFVSTASGSAITPFTTTSFVSAFDTVFYPASCAVVMGLDFVEDAAPDFGQQVMAQINQEALRWLDEQIAVGDGTTEPQGIFTASGTVVSPISGHTYSSFTFNDFVNLAFGITKAYRNNFGGDATRFVMNDQQYKQALQIATGVTGDTRAIFGMNWKDYMLGDYGVSVQNNISNGNMALCNLRGYRMYQRKGLEFVRDHVGYTNRVANQEVLVGRMRYGGQITLTGYIGELTA